MTSERGRVFIIAEAGVNHNGQLALARELVDVAVEARADCVKFQTFVPEGVMTESAPKAAYQQETTGEAESQIEMVRKLQLPFDAFRELKAYAERHGILFLSTPFDYDSADFLDELGMTLFKIPSGEITNLPFLEHVARKRKPVLLSTGMSTLDEVEAAVNVVRGAGSGDLTLLQCVSAYPARAEDVNLRAMATMASAFSLPVGLSDHTTGTEVALAATALGAAVIEKHFTLDQDLPGPDHRASLNPDQLRQLVQQIRNVESALGSGEKRPVAAEADVARVARRSLVAARDIARGTVLTRELIAIKRPGTGMPPAALGDVVGRTAGQAIAKDALITPEMLA